MLAEFRRYSLDFAEICIFTDSSVEFDEIFAAQNIRMTRQQGAGPRVGFEIHDLDLRRLSFASSCELELSAV